ncbi:MAG: ABC transporter permease [Oscillospiraceae bacterium]
MTGLFSLVKRSMKVYFKDKGMFFTSLITPLILLVLYATFLRNVYESSFTDALNEAGVSVSEALINGCVGGQLVSSLLAVSCITVAFCSNMLMVQDKYSGVGKDIAVSPVKGRTVALGYYIGAFVSTLLVNLVAAAVCFLYLRSVGWYLSGADVAKVLLDVVLLVMFGTALSSIINCFLSTQGQMSAVGTVVSAGYGFICGAYMPISQFSEGLQKAISFLPGTYGTSLLKNHMLRGVFAEMEDQHFPAEVVEAIKDSVDCNIYFMDEKVLQSNMYICLIAATAVAVLIYVMINALMRKRTV